MSKPFYTDADKLASVEREIVMRKQVYGPRVLNRKMSPGEAEREIGIMKAIADDYRLRIERAAAGGSDLQADETTPPKQ